MDSWRVCLLLVLLLLPVSPFIIPVDIRHAHVRFLLPWLDFPARVGVLCVTGGEGEGDGYEWTFS